MSYLIEETIRELSKPTTLLSIIVEGKDDASVYRYIEERINNVIDLDIGEVNTYPCVGLAHLDRLILGFISIYTCFDAPLHS